MNRAYNREIQKILFPASPEEWDGILGPKSRAEIQHLRDQGIRVGIASSFADPADVRAFDKWYKIYISEGYSPENAKRKAYAKGDNAVGCWEDSTREGTGPSCAIPPDDMIELFGSVSKAKHRRILVTGNNRVVSLVIKDRMPWKKNIVNGAIIDINPDGVKELGWEPPMMHAVKWQVEPEG